MPPGETASQPPFERRDTRASLLLSLRESAAPREFEAAWQRFYEHYSPMMYRWCRGLGVKPEDAEHIVQETMLKLVQHLRTFEYDREKRFRGFLKKVTRNVAIDLLRRNANVVLAGGSHLGEVLATNTVEEWLDDLMRSEILVAAGEQVRRELLANPEGSRNWEIFVATTRAGESAESVAARWGVPVRVVHVEKSRVLMRVKRAVAELEREE